MGLCGLSNRIAACSMASAAWSGPPWRRALRSIALWLLRDPESVCPTCQHLVMILAEEQGTAVFQCPDGHGRETAEDGVLGISGVLGMLAQRNRPAKRDGHKPPPETAYQTSLVETHRRPSVFWRKVCAVKQEQARPPGNMRKISKLVFYPFLVKNEVDITSLEFRILLTFVGVSENLLTHSQVAVSG